MSDFYERSLDGFGERLRGAEASRTSPRPSRKLALGGSLVVTCVLAITFIFVLSGSPAGRQLDAVAQARAALAPFGQIIYLRIRTEAPGPASSSGVTEQWTAVGPPRWRVQQGPLQFSYASGTQSRYSTKSDRLVVTTGLDDRSSAARQPGPLGGDPASGLREMLSSGGVRDLGEVSAGGRTVRRLVRDIRAPNVRSTFTYDVDPQSFAPISAVLKSTLTPKAPAAPRQFTATFTVEQYERLPLTAANARLLRIPTTSATRRTVTPAG